MESNLSASSSNHVIVSVQYDCFVSLNEIHQFSVLSLKMFVFVWALMSRSRHLNWAGNPPISWLRRLLNCQQTPPIRHTKGGNGSDPVSRSNVQNLAAFSSEVADRNQLNNPFLTFSYNWGPKNVKMWKDLSRVCVYSVCCGLHNYQYFSISASISANRSH